MSDELTQAAVRLMWDAESEADELRAERDGYRTALEAIGQDCPHRRPCDCLVTIALNALARPDTPEEAPS